MKSMKLLSKSYAVLCILLAVWLGAQFVQHTPIQTQLTALLPQHNTSDPVWLAADQAQEKQLNQQIIVLVGADNPDKAFESAAQVAQRWQQSGLFAAVDSQIEPDVAALRQSLTSLGAATLPAEQVHQLYENPQQYFTERAEAAANPFSGSLLSLEDDWLGFSRFVLQKQSSSQLLWHNEHAMLYTERDGKTWVWLRARLPNTTPNIALLNLLHKSKTQAQAEHYQILATGGALFAAHAKQNAERESSLMSAVGLSLTFALLLAVFRSWRVLAVGLPLAVGVLVGLVATVAVFGEIHTLTLVVGTSLVGVLVDFPLHWLAPSLFRQPENAWHGAESMRRVLPSFVISLAITVLGYALLWFTPLPVLRQTAVFSAAALLGAVAATVCFLPPLFARYQAKTWQISWANLSNHNVVRQWRLLAAILAIFLCIGASKSQWQDDIRQWANLPPDLLADAQHIAQISGMGASKTILLRADSADKLLKLNQQVEQKLHQHGFTQTQSLHQWLLPSDEQMALKNQLAKLARQPEQFAPLVDLGVPPETVQAALNQAASAPVVALADSLAAPQAEGFRDLYLGEISGQFASVLRVGGDDVAAVALPDGAMWLDKRAHLNQQFSETRFQAAWLKILSFALAWVMLWWRFGWRRGSLMLAVAVAAVLGTIGALGWLGVAVGLFAMFGLLLAAAIGVDYAVYTLTAPESKTARLAGITLAAATTSISFILLMFSTTPAVASFGLSVAIGVGLSWLGAVGLLCGQTDKP
ncbi:Predicted exporter [Alysiella crassa]|uniref:Predicted exporter n=2 Tax=Alysiella crassa TaxID=153491 RepID=A0A376BUU7_9NEIS|nr:Predicted exporter [Alysiella crassa]